LNEAIEKANPGAYDVIEHFSKNDLPEYCACLESQESIPNDPCLIEIRYHDIFIRFSISWTNLGRGKKERENHIPL
jgi:hypothetical protein